MRKKPPWLQQGILDQANDLTVMKVSFPIAAMKSFFELAVLLLFFCGCGNPVRPLSDDAVIKSNRLLDVLSTNATVRAIKATEAIRTNLEAVSDVRHRRDVIAAWKRSLLNIPVDRLPPSERYASVRESHSVLTWALVGAEWEIEPSYEKMWSVYFEALAWLDEQCKKMKPDGKQRITDIWVQKGKWDYYQALVEYRESAIENLELNGFDESLYNVEAARMDVVRRKFEKLIDRSVRPRKDIKLLGHYVKEVRVKVVRERDQALSLLNEQHMR